MRWANLTDLRKSEFRMIEDIKIRKTKEEFSIVEIIRQSNLLPLHVQASVLALVIAIHHRVPSFQNARGSLHCWSLFRCSWLAFLLLWLLFHSCSCLCLHHWGRSGCSSGTGWRSLEKGNSFMLTNYPKKCTPSVEQSGEGV